ncbi:carcinoembryonic antigen-related cell adhesion molecule 21-like [Dipodomys merriami]|uniref:carcinoembryonic antigen-related cell adhesion molecule 21-like n=1 Tax=Dipodomys merriami TaxID=94247 RepID=UPI00384A6958
MELLAAFLHGGPGPWRGHLLAASIFFFWSLPATAQLSIELVPSNAVQGTNVLLRVHNVPKNIKSYTWYKGQRSLDNHQMVIFVVDHHTIVRGPDYSGREKIYRNGSLLLQSVNWRDAGYYTLRTLTRDLRTQGASGQLRVFQPVARPSIQASNTTVTDQGSVVLTCYPGDPGTSIRWIFNNQGVQLTERMKLAQDNSTLRLDPVRREDAGEYRCEVSNPASASQSDPLVLEVTPSDP